ncbi:DivIVA domain-containing protein [Microbacterium indicum]|uniref:DivIVA domain-containing protein n=1 Tax=Microbacterium indicum TaxID=358100 RepID=UPI0003FD149E|nr:DivIVA domain-containing protein [Microbacterium indicum]
MALTPEDVVTKQFQHVRFKEGFDPDEVDDFLDEIVVEWRKTIEENEQLKARVAELEDAAKKAAAAPAPAPAAEKPAEKPAPKKEEPAPAPVAAAPAAESGVSSTAASAAGIIARAERLHDEHVAEGQAKASKAVADAEAKASKLVSDAESKATGIVSAAEAKQREISEKLNAERTTLEGRITELRQFERDYRQQLRGYFEQKLADLDESGSKSGGKPSSNAGL